MATPPGWTPGGGEGLAVTGTGVGVGNTELGTGVTTGVGDWAKAAEQTIDAPQTIDSLIDLTGGIVVYAFSAAMSE